MKIRDPPRGYTKKEEKKTKFYKTILTLLAITLAVIGTTATVVHAEGPETPPAPDQNINSYLDQATQDLVDEMNPTFQAFVTEAWEDLKAMAPSGDWEDVIQDIIPQIHADAESQGGIVGSPTALTSSCNLSKYSMLGSSGWAAAVTKSSCVKVYLKAEVTASSYGNKGLCFDWCKSVSAYVNGLPCTNYYVKGDHEWRYPTVTRTSSAEGQAGCE